MTNLYPPTLSEHCLDTRAASNPEAQQVDRVTH